MSSRRASIWASLCFLYWPNSLAMAEAVVSTVCLDAMALSRSAFAPESLRPRTTMAAAMLAIVMARTEIMPGSPLPPLQSPMA